MGDLIYREALQNYIDEMYAVSEKEIRAKAIEEFAEKCNKKISDFILEHQTQLTFISGVAMGWRLIESVAKEMKGE
jgi:hypothetical protein